MASVDSCVGGWGGGCGICVSFLFLAWPDDICNFLGPSALVTHFMSSLLDGKPIKARFRVALM